MRWMTETTTKTMTTTDAHLEAFDALGPVLPGSGHGWIEALRRAALGRFRGAGLPTRRLEAWKFTGLAALEREAFSPAAEAARDAVLPRAPELGETAARLVFVDGRFHEGLSQVACATDGITITTLARALAEGDAAIEDHLSEARDPAGALADLNAAFMADGAVIRLADGAALEAPVSLVFLSSAAHHASHVRNLILIGAGARARVVETYVAASADAASFTNAVTDIALADGAALTHLRIQDEGARAVHAARAVVAIGAGAEYSGFALAMGAEVSRQETEAVFTAPRGRLRLMGAYLGRGRQLLDHTTRVDHAVPGCETEELFKGVLDDHARGVFQGLIRVSPHAVGTDARQKNQALLLSERAAADTKPELEILADDVKCAHGAAVGDLDEEALFYLMARGVPEDEARGLLIAGFAGDVIERFDTGTLGAYLAGWVALWQERGMGGTHA